METLPMIDVAIVIKFRDVAMNNDVMLIYC